MDSVSLEGNMALPFTLSIEPLLPEVREAVASLAAEVGLPAALLPAPVGNLGDADRARVHLARALSMKPQLLLLEHPTARLPPDDAAAFGRLLSSIGNRRGLGWLAISEDEAFSTEAGGTRCRLAPASGEISAVRRGWRLW